MRCTSSSAPAMALLLTLLWATEATALTALVERCEAALAADDKAEFAAVVEAIETRKDVFDVSVRQRMEACLSEGFGEPWAYSFPDNAWLPVSEADARAASRAAYRATEVRSREQAEADREANAERVSFLVYSSCAELFRRDQVAAMTNALCVDTFLVNGVPDS